MKTPLRFGLLGAIALIALFLPLQLAAQLVETASDNPLLPLSLFEAPEVPFPSLDLVDPAHLSTDGAICEKKAGEDGVLLDPVFEAIQNGPCAWCTTNSNCSTPCIDDNEQQSDCGDYGVCDPCKEGIVEIDRQIIGNFAQRKWLTLCEFRTHYIITYQSVNAGCQPFTKCVVEIQTHTVPTTVSCCSIVPGCFGTQCP